MTTPKKETEAKSERKKRVERIVKRDRDAVPAKNPGGRPRLSSYRQKELWEARRVARTAIAEWRRLDCPEVVSEKHFGLVARIDPTDLGRLNTWFPKIKVVPRKPYKWRIGDLLQILLWDDPVTMLQDLAAADPGWWEALGKAELAPCTPAQEEAVRMARHNLVYASKNLGLWSGEDKARELAEANRKMRKYY